MRILFVNHIPAQRELGAGRVQLELAEEIRRRGHDVDFFTPVEAGTGRSLKVGALTVPSFAWPAQRHLARVGGSYDVIEAQQALVTRSKKHLGIDGVLVTRSSGLVELYRKADHELTQRLPADARGRQVGRVLRRIEWKRSSIMARRSFGVSDLIHVPNSDELRTLQSWGLGQKSRVIPNALDQQVLDALAEVARATRPAEPTVTFVASWTYRKGLADWGRIVAATWRRNSRVRFHFAGTGAAAHVVLRDIGVGDDPRIQVTPSFAASDLPGILAQSTVGALPSYVEGFGLGVLETLAAGRPCIAYDIPGPRDLAGAVEKLWLVQRGDPDAFAARLCDVIALEEQDPGGRSGECVAFAADFSWKAVASATLDFYEVGRSRLT